ncbi:MAG TPA: ankyrin repeat domain-containing protein [Candidatus Limnocylindria bacterium]
MATEFLAAVKKGDRDAVERMLRSDPELLAAKDERGTSALLLAYYHGKAEIANSLLTHRPDLDLYEAATVGDAGRIRELVGRSADVNAYAADGFTALGLAAFFKRRDAVRALLDAGAAPNLASRPAGFTPLHSAVADDAGTVTSDIVRVLLDAGADPNAQSASGGTPLHTAAFIGDVAVARMLLAAGADPNMKDARELTPLDVARERANSEVAALLHDAVIGRKTS